ncbi:LPP20 family lipoprotein [Bdellovibrionota bacterium FG-2]
MNHNEKTPPRRKVSQFLLILLMPVMAVSYGVLTTAAGELTSDGWRASLREKFPSAKYRLGFGISGNLSEDPESAQRIAVENARIELAKSISTKIEGEQTLAKRTNQTTGDSDSGSTTTTQSTSIRAIVSVQMEGVDVSQIKRFEGTNTVEAVAVMDVGQYIGALQNKSKQLALETRKLEGTNSKCQPGDPSSMNSWRKMIENLSRWQSYRDLALALDQSSSIQAPGGLQEKQAQLQKCRSSVTVSVSGPGDSGSLAEKIADVLARQGFSTRHNSGRSIASVGYQVKYTLQLGKIEEVFGSYSVSGLTEVELITPKGGRFSRRTKTLRAMGAERDEALSGLKMRLAIKGAELVSELLVEQL